MLSLSLVPEGELHEHALRTEEVSLRLALAGGARWSASARRGELGGLRLSIEPAVSLRVLRVTSASDNDLVLTMAAHPTYDTPADTELTLSAAHLCGGAGAIAAAPVPCHDGAADAAPANSLLRASLAVRSDGAPPARPGRPFLTHAFSYEALMLVWAPPAAAGDSAVGGYAWVEYVGGTPVLSGDAIDAARMWDNASLYARIGGFRKGYGILPGAIVAYNRGGFSPVSEPWGAATMGKPATPAALRCEYDALGGGGGGGLRLGWRAPEWDGGYPVASYEVSLQKWDESAARWRGVEGHDGVVVDAPPPNASAAAAAAAAPAPAAAEAAAAAAAEVVHVIDEAMAAGEYRFRVTALNSQGDESARATSDSAAVPGGWCGWEGPGAALGCAGAVGVAVGALALALAAAAAAWWWRRRQRRARTAEARGGLADRVAALHAQAIKGGSRTAAQYDPVHLDDVRLTADGAAGGFGVASAVCARRGRPQRAAPAKRKRETR